MKIEICEQMVQSWLKHCKSCEIVQTNWTISPLRVIEDSEIAAVEKFMKEIQAQLDQDLNAEDKAALQNEFDEDLRSDGGESVIPQKRLKNVKTLNIFKKSTARQYISQCEIDVVGCKFNDGTAEMIYLVDTAFHKGGLGYHDSVATVMKKLIRALVVAVIIFGENVPVTVAFASPRCRDSVKNDIDNAVSGLCKILGAHPRYANIRFELYFNERFTDEVYTPMVKELEALNNDNDLFMRAVNLAKLAEDHKTPPPVAGSSLPAPAKVASGGSTPSSARTVRGGNQKTVFDILKKVIKDGKMTPALLAELRTPEYSRKNFKLPTYPVLKSLSEFPFSGHDRCRYYKPTLKIGAEEYLVCSQWVPERIELLEAWYTAL